jgi:ATP-dependent protease HslVU (ClpYQ) peptidase subunit
MMVLPPLAQEALLPLPQLERCLNIRIYLQRIAAEAMAIAADICIYTNHSIVVEEL